MSYNRSKSFSILELVSQLIAKAIDWSNNEMAFIRVDAKSLLRRYLVGLSLLVTSFAVLLAAIFTLVQTVVGALARFLHGHMLAGFIVSLVLFLITVLLLLGARYCFRTKPRPKALVFRRLLGEEK